MHFKLLPIHTAAGHWQGPHPLGPVTGGFDVLGAMPGGLSHSLNIEALVWVGPDRAGLDTSSRGPALCLSISSQDMGHQQDQLRGEWRGSSRVCCAPIPRSNCTWQHTGSALDCICRGRSIARYQIHLRLLSHFQVSAGTGLGTRDAQLRWQVWETVVGLPELLALGKVGKAAGD